MGLAPVAHCHAETTRTMATVGMAHWQAALSGQEGHNSTIRSARAALAVAEAFLERLGGLGLPLHRTAQLDAIARASQFAPTTRFHPS